MFKKRGFAGWKGLVVLTVVTFLMTVLMADVLRVKTTQASILNLPEPTKLLPLSNYYSFPVLKGLKLDKYNPLNISFIVDKADEEKLDKETSARLIKYFLAALTVPEEELWVNLSPYEEERISGDVLAQTDMGKDLLGQDYVLKQLVSSVTYPKSETGADFWQETYDRVIEIAGTTNIPINTFNKIWIVPGDIEVIEYENNAVLTQADLKAMMEEDYLAMNTNAKEIKKEIVGGDYDIEQVNKVSSAVMRELILPKIEEDVNSGKNFALLRQVYHSLVLGMWFKNKFKESFFAHYIDSAKLEGINYSDKNIKDKIFDLYVKAFQKGVYDYTTKAYDRPSRQNLRRRYFSGGVEMLNVSSAVEVSKKVVSAPEDFFEQVAVELDTENIEELDVYLNPENISDEERLKLSAQVSEWEEEARLTGKVASVGVLTDIDAAGQKFIALIERGVSIASTEAQEALAEFNLHVGKAQHLEQLVIGSSERLVRELGDDFAFASEFSVEPVNAAMHEALKNLDKGIVKEVPKYSESDLIHDITSKFHDIVGENIEKQRAGIDSIDAIDMGIGMKIMYHWDALGKTYYDGQENITDQQIKAKNDELQKEIIDDVFVTLNLEATAQNIDVVAYEIFRIVREELFPIALGDDIANRIDDYFSLVETPLTILRDMTREDLNFDLIPETVSFADFDKSTKEQKLTLIKTNQEEAFAEMFETGDIVLKEGRDSQGNFNTKYYELSDVEIVQSQINMKEVDVYSRVNQALRSEPILQNLNSSDYVTSVIGDQVHVKVLATNDQMTYPLGRLMQKSQAVIFTANDIEDRLDEMFPSARLEPELAESYEKLKDGTAILLAKITTAAEIFENPSNEEAQELYEHLNIEMQRYQQDVSRFDRLVDQETLDMKIRISLKSFVNYAKSVLTKGADFVNNFFVAYENFFDRSDAWILERDRRLKEFLKSVLVKSKNKIFANSQLKAETVGYTTDAHGSQSFIDMTKDLLKKSKYVVNMGDIFDRGTSNKKVFEFVKKQTEAGKLVNILGNHDMMFIETMLSDDTDRIDHSSLNWLMNGGINVLEEYNVPDTELALLKEQIVMFRKAFSSEQTQTIFDEISRVVDEYVRPNIELKEVAEWLLENSKLYHIDDHGMFSSHAGLPLQANKDGELSVDLEYKKVTGLDALDLMQEDMANGNINPELISKLTDGQKGLLWNRGWMDKAKKYGPDAVLAAINKSDSIAHEVKQMSFGHTNQKDGSLFDLEGKIIGLDRAHYKEIGAGLVNNSKGTSIYNYSEGDLVERERDSFFQRMKKLENRRDVSVTQYSKTDAVGGIDLQGMDIGSSAGSSIFAFAPFDLTRFNGFSFSILAHKSFQSNDDLREFFLG